MLAEIRDAFFKYAPFLILIPLWIIIRIKNRPEELKPIVYYLILSVLTQAVSFIFWMSKINNLPILHIYTILEFIILSWFYYILLKKDISYFIFISVALLFTVFSLIGSVYIENFFTFNTISRSLASLVFIFLSVLRLLKSLTVEDMAPNKNNKGVDYITAGFLVYFSGSIVLFSFSNYLNKLAYGLLLNIWSIHTLLLVLLYSAITIGLLRYKIK